MKRKSNTITKGWMDEEYKWLLKKEAAENRMSLLEYQRFLAGKMKKKEEEVKAKHGFDFKF